MDKFFPISGTLNLGILIFGIFILGILNLGIFILGILNLGKEILGSLKFALNEGILKDGIFKPLKPLKLKPNSSTPARVTILPSSLGIE